MEREVIKAWVTTYALTQGILVVEGEVCHEINSAMLSYRSSGYEYPMNAHGKDWHRTPEAALARAEEMRTAKIASLKKSITRLEALKFTVP